MKSFLQLFLLSLLIIICVFFYNKYFTEKKVIKKIEIETVIENDSLEKKNNMDIFNYQNTWNNINQKIISTINEN